jgi:hypothetical protein
MVTDGEIDRFFLALLAAWLRCKVNATDDIVSNKRSTPTSSYTNTRQLLEAIAQARNACKLPYLTGAAVAAYGVPVISELFLELS